MFRPIDILLGICVSLTWGMGLVFAKAAVAHFPPILLMSLRFSVTALALLWFVKIPRAAFKQLLLIAFISATIQYSLTYSGLARLDASITALVVQLEVPFLTILGIIWLKESASWLHWLGIVMAFVGVMIIAGQPQLQGQWFALLLVVAGSFTWAIGQVMIRRLANVDAMSLTAWIAFFASWQLLLMSLAVESNHWQALQSADWVVWSAVLYLGLVMTAFGYGCWNTLIRRYMVSKVAPFLLLLPIFSILGGYFFLNERLERDAIIGGIIILLGVALIFRQQHKDAVQAT